MTSGPGLLEDSIIPNDGEGETSTKAEVVERHYDDKSIQSQEFNDAESRGYFAGGSSEFRLHQQEKDLSQRDGAAE